MSAPQYDTQNMPSLEEQAIRLLGFVVVLIIVGPITVLASVGLYAKLRSQGIIGSRWFLSISLAATLGFAVLVRTTVMGDIAVYSRFMAAGIYKIDLPMLMKMWLSTVPLIPAGVVLIQLTSTLHGLLLGGTLEHWIVDEEQARANRESTLSRLALKRQSHAPAKRPGDIRLGPWIKGDTFPETLGVHKRGRWLSLSESLLDQHLLLVGTTGAGKSEAIKRIAYEVLASTDRDLFVVDGKGDDELAQMLKAVAWSTSHRETPIFRLGTGKPGALYNGFCGAPQDLYSRLLALSGISDAEGNAQYYADVNRDLLQLICYASGGPPRSFEELRERLSLDWIRTAWRDSAAESDAVESFKRDDIEALARRLRPLIREFAPLVNPRGFCLDDARTAVFSIRTQSVSDTAARFLSFLVEDLKDFAGKRQKRPGVLIVDEFGAFGNHNIIALLSLARSAKLGIILATQDAASLGDEVTKRLILANSRTKILMATDFPEEVASLAGTIYQLESSIQHEGGQATGMGSARVQHAFKIDMNEVARLQPGEAFMIRQRYAAKVRISAIKGEPVPPTSGSNTEFPRSRQLGKPLPTSNAKPELASRSVHEHGVDF